MYAYFKNLHYFSTECVFAPNAYRGHVRTFLKDLEKIRPASIINIIHSGESIGLKKGIKLPQKGTCSKCGFVSSQLICKACTLLAGLNKGLPKIGIGKTSKVNKALSKLTTDELIQI
ncbi:cancer-associated gene protein, putative [Pediculus humanus corporis]|uniref:Cancer-associated gene protein, putative n=1 Tax=Pediculus humanus subsp. corporis TaxID=121224 RepID=E0W0K5_PEDHC|nr:cancer-associated gene protein, putative [Pediculus humanus corporis]EEB19161.1 cancer-associated gene protein, putative [Pediculus humanus corporis]